MFACKKLSKTASVGLMTGLRWDEGKAYAEFGLWGSGGVGLGALGGVEVDGAGGFVESPDGDGGEDEDDGPEGDEDGGGPFGGEVRPEVKEGATVADADPDGDGVAREAAEGEGSHEFFARHADGAGGEDEGGERHRRREDGGQGDGEDGVGFHPGGDAGEDAGGDVLFEEGHASGLTGGVGEASSDGGAEGGDGDEEDGVGVAGGVEDEHDVGDAGDGERDEGAVDDGDEEEADEAEVEEEVHEGVMDGVRGRSRGLEREEGREWGGGETHAGDMTLVGRGESREKSLKVGQVKSAASSLSGMVKGLRTVMEP
jgi:hypothetical protein